MSVSCIFQPLILLAMLMRVGDWEGGVVCDKQKVAISQLSWGNGMLSPALLQGSCCSLQPIQYLRWLEQCSEAIFSELLWENKQRLPRLSVENIIWIFDTKFNQGPFCGGCSFYQASLAQPVMQVIGIKISGKQKVLPAGVHLRS